MASSIVSRHGRTLGQAVPRSPSAALVIPGFLVPAWQDSASRQQFSTTTKRPSKLGRTPLTVPPGVEILISDPITTRKATEWKSRVHKSVTVKGPLGELKLEVPEFVKIEQDVAAQTAKLTVEDDNIKQQKEMWGTSWAMLNNHITGVSEGHTAIMRLVGVGYRATVEERGGKAQFPGQKFLCLKLGFTHPVEEGIPKGVTVTTPSPTRILIEGPDREVIMSFAGRVRLWRKPEPYKGKGIFINDETIKLKSKKIS